VSLVDLEGNARLSFDTVFIDRPVPNQPKPERREFRSLFKPKSGQVLRVLLRDPKQMWKVTELAEAAEVVTDHRPTGHYLSAFPLMPIGRQHSRDPGFILNRCCLLPHAP
jgi:hypothetical protein